MLPVSVFALALADTVLATVAATVLTPPPATGADASLVGAAGEVSMYGEATAEGFLIIDTVNSPFDVFTAFALLITPKKKHPTGA